MDFGYLNFVAHFVITDENPAHFTWLELVQPRANSRIL
jgi:hypothetical protein